MAEAIDLFEEEYPNITVVEEPVGAPDDLFNRLATDFASGTAPDVFALGGAKPQEYGAAGALLDLATVSEYLPTDKYADFTLTNAVVDDTLYGLPTGGNAIGVLINPAIFEAAGVDVPTEDWTWEDFVDTANEISANAGDGVVGLDLRIQDILGTYAAQYTDTGIYDWDGNLAVDADTIQQWYEMEQELVEGGGLPDPSVIVEHWNVTPDLTPVRHRQGGDGVRVQQPDRRLPAGAGGDVQIITPPTSTDVSGISVLPSQFWAIASGDGAPGGCCAARGLAAQPARGGGDHPRQPRSAVQPRHPRGRRAAARPGGRPGGGLRQEGARGRRRRSPAAGGWRDPQRAVAAHRVRHPVRQDRRSRTARSSGWTS